MTVMTTFSLPHRRALTRADLAVVPDDGHRYELIDGSLIVSPAPQIRHQDAVMRLGVLLFEACPPELKVLSAPVDVVLADDSVIQPDLLVARRDQFTDNDLRTAAAGHRGAVAVDAGYRSVAQEGPVGAGRLPALLGCRSGGPDDQRVDAAGRPSRQHPDSDRG